MNKNKSVCDKCKGQGVVEVFEPVVDFEVLMPCPGCDKEIENSLMDFLEG